MVSNLSCDAPALKRADVGIAVQVYFFDNQISVRPASIGCFSHLFLPQGSTDAARAAADIVLTEGLG